MSNQRVPNKRATVADRREPSALRVTPDELACAVAAVEARRDAANNDTIAIGDAIDQLGLRVSPEEVAAEVDARRAELSAQADQSRVRRSQWRKWLFTGAFLFSVALNLKLLTQETAGPARPPAVETFEQSGRFNVEAGKEGIVRFPQPFGSVPNLELSLSPSFNKTVVAETMSWGFRWKNTGPDNLFNNSSVPWKARGIR
jgi:hypothetical protein